MDSDNHYTTAYELAIISNYAMKNPIFAKVVGTKMYSVTINGYPKTINNTNELLGNLSGVYGIKTGFTNGANRCLVSCCKRGSLDIICVVLGADTKSFRTRDSVKLIEYVFKNFEVVNAKELMESEFLNWKNKNIDSFFVEKGVSNSVSIKLSDLNCDFIPLLRVDISKINVEVVCDKFFVAPLYSNSVIGGVSLKVGDDVIAKCDIVVDGDVSRMSVFDYLLGFFRNYIGYLNEGS